MKIVIEDKGEGLKRQFDIGDKKKQAISFFVGCKAALEEMIIRTCIANSWDKDYIRLIDLRAKDIVRNWEEGRYGNFS